MATITKRVRERPKEPLITWQAWYSDQNGKRRIVSLQQRVGCELVPVALPFHDSANGSPSFF